MLQNTDSIIANRSTVDNNYKGKTFDTYADLALVLGLTLLTLAFIFVPLLSHNFLRFVFGILLTLFIPGYTFVAALYPGNKDLGSPERFVLSVGLSAVLVPFLGFFLNFSKWGITLDTMILSVTAFILLWLLVALVRRILLPVDKRFKVGFGVPVGYAKKMILPASGERGEVVISALMTCSLLLLGAVLTYLVIMPYQPDKYTEFYLCGPEGKMSNYPANLTVGEKTPLIVGIVNRQGATKEYDLAVTLTDGSQSSRIYLDHLVLADNETLEKTINLTPDRVGTGQNLKFLLYMDGSPADPYRECNLWVNVTEPGVNTAEPGTLETGLAANQTVAANSTLAGNTTTTTNSTAGSQ